LVNFEILSDILKSLKMDIFLIIAGIVCIAVGIAGCVLPVLPGPPVAYIALILLQLTSSTQLHISLLVIMGLIVLAITILDYVVPVWGTKKFGGSKGGSWGSTIGLIIGVFFSPLSALTSIILFPFIGAFIGEIIYGKKINEALRAAFGSFIGFLTGVFMKIAVSLVIAFMFFYYWLT